MRFIVSKRKHIVRTATHYNQHTTPTHTLRPHPSIQPPHTPQPTRSPWHQPRQPRPHCRHIQHQRSTHSPKARHYHCLSKITQNRRPYPTRHQNNGRIKPIRLPPSHPAPGNRQLRHLTWHPTSTKTTNQQTQTPQTRTRT